MTEEFKDIQETAPTNQEQENNKPFRVRLPKNKNEMLGVIEKRHGGNKMNVSCTDGKERNCRVPGRLKRKLWLRPNDVVLIELWELDKSKGDVIFKYRLNQINWLKKNGHLKNERDEF